MAGTLGTKIYSGTRGDSPVPEFRLIYYLDALSLTPFTRETGFRGDLSKTRVSDRFPNEADGTRVRSSGRLLRHAFTYTVHAKSVTMVVRPGGRESRGTLGEGWRRTGQRQRTLREGKGDPVATADVLSPFLRQVVECRPMQTPRPNSIKIPHETRDRRRHPGVSRFRRLSHQHFPSHLGRFPNEAEGTAHPFSGTSSSGLTQIASNVPTAQVKRRKTPRGLPGARSQRATSAMVRWLHAPGLQAPHGEVPFHPTAFLRAAKRRAVSSQPTPLDDKGLAESESWRRASRKVLRIPQSCSPTVSGGLFFRLRTPRDVRHQRSNRLIPGERPASVVDAVFTARRRIFPPAGTLGTKIYSGTRGDSLAERKNG